MPANVEKLIHIFGEIFRGKFKRQIKKNKFEYTVGIGPEKSSIQMIQYLNNPLFFCDCYSLSNGPPGPHEGMTV